jgi:hypothetical protein
MITVYEPSFTVRLAAGAVLLDFYGCENPSGKPTIFHTHHTLASSINPSSSSSSSFNVF